MNITSKTKICMIIGDPINNSLSPEMHNAGYEAVGLTENFIFTASNVAENDLKDAVLGIRAMKIHGITVTHPHKVNIMQFIDKIDPIAEKIGAVNTVVNDNGKLVGYNTDWIGVYEPLEEKMSLKNKSVAVIGAGGAAHAAVFALLRKNAKVTIFNRTLKHAEELAMKFGCDFTSLENQDEVKKMDVIINLTTCGMNENDSPIEKEFIQKTQIVCDAVYSPYETKLLHNAKEQGATIIHGTEMLIFQGVAQFELFTGKKVPTEIMRKAVMKGLNL